MTLGREQVKTDHFVDLDNGPSFLTKRQNVPTFTETKGGKAKTIFEEERS